MRPVRWLVSELVWAGWCWFIVREKHCWLAGLGWLKSTSEQADDLSKQVVLVRKQGKHQSEGCGYAMQSWTDAREHLYL